MLVKFEKFNRQLSSLFEWVGLAAMLVMMVITCIDVVGAKVFQWRLFGAIDIVMLCQIVAIAFAASMVLILGRHIQVDFFINRLPKRLQAVINSVAFLIGLGLFSLVVWQLFVLGYSFQTQGESSATARIPYYPFAYGIALASIPVCLIYLMEFLNSIGRIAQK
ncbi:MAG: TRAP transporter small permease [Deltaproteobacteria bacterium]|nr:TRAP transporter small permease [Deltaproteobacteria bacterium]